MNTDKSFNIKKSTNGMYIVNYYLYTSDPTAISTDETMVFNSIEEVLSYIKDRV